MRAVDERNYEELQPSGLAGKIQWIATPTAAGS
jgi:hypothetical protein